MSATVLSNEPVRPITLDEDDRAFYTHYGYLPLPGFLHQQATEAMHDETLSVLEHACGISRTDLQQSQTSADKLRQCGQYLENSVIDQVINSPHTLSIASYLIGGKAIRYSPFTAVKAGGGGGAFHMHQDNNYTTHEPALGSINIWVALVDMSPSNGCLYIKPGSHHDGTLTSVAGPDDDGHKMVKDESGPAFPIRMRAGDAVAFSRLTVHGSGPNTTCDPRVAYALQYHRKDVRYLDHETDSWPLLTEKPRFFSAPVSSFSEV